MCFSGLDDGCGYFSGLDDGCGYFSGLNPLKSSVRFVGHRQTVQNQVRRHKTWRPIRIFTVCYLNVQLKFEEK